MKWLLSQNRFFCTIISTCSCTTLKMMEVPTIRQLRAQISSNFKKCQKGLFFASSEQHNSNWHTVNTKNFSDFHFEPSTAEKVKCPFHVMSWWCSAQPQTEKQNRRFITQRGMATFKRLQFKALPLVSCHLSWRRTWNRYGQWRKIFQICFHSAEFTMYGTKLITN